jgi:hypothetical protein
MGSTRLLRSCPREAFRGSCFEHDTYPVFVRTACRFSPGPRLVGPGLSKRPAG